MSEVGNETLEISTRRIIAEDNSSKVKINELKGVSEQTCIQAEQHKIAMALAEALTGMLSNDEKKKKRVVCLSRKTK